MPGSSRAVRSAFAQRWRLALGLSLSLLLGGCAAPHSEVIDARPEAVASIEKLMPAGARVAFRRSCISCHGLDGRGIVGVAPDLTKARARTADEWEKYLRDPQSGHPGSQTPALFWLNADEIKAVAAFLARQNDPVAAASDGESPR